MAKKRSENHQSANYKNTSRQFQSALDDDDEVSIDFGELLAIIKRKILVIVLMVVICAGGTAAYTQFFMAPTYASSGTIFLTPLITESGTADYTSLNSNSKLVNNVMTLLTQNNIMTRVAEESGLDSAGAVRSKLSITNVKDTEVIVVKATTTDPKLSKSIAKNTIEIFIDSMKDNLNVKNIEVVDSPRLSYSPVGPNLLKNTVYGAAFGFGLACVYVLLILFTDNSLKNKDIAERYVGVPVLCEIPEIK